MDDIEQETLNKESKPLLDEPSKTICTIQIIGYVIVVVQAIFYAISIVSTQVAGLDLNLLQYNMVRYFIQALVAFGMVQFGKNSVKILRDDLSYFITIGLLDMTGTVFIFGAATYLPVGNLDAFFNAVLVIIASCYQIIKRTISYLGVLIYMTLAIGILVLMQPWNKQEQRRLIHITPCSYLGRSPNDSVVLITGNDSSNMSGLLIDTDATEDILPAGWLTKHSTLLAYAVVCIAALEFSAHGKLSESLLKNYKVPVVVFWVSLLEGILSFIISLVWQSLRGESFFMVPDGSFCVLFMCMYILFMAFCNSSTYYTISMFKVYPHALSIMPSVVLLYFLQRTALKSFHPGNANMVEILGVVFIIFGIVGWPLLSKLVKSKQKEED